MLLGSALVLATASLAGAALLRHRAPAVSLALVWACPLYVTKNAGFCFREIDVLGGWITSVTYLFAADAAALVVILLVSAKG